VADGTDRRVEYVPLSEVRPAQRNPKAHLGDAIRGSISRFGLGELPLIDERTGRLVAGHGRIDQLTAMRADGQDAPEGVRLDAAGEWLVPVVRGWSSRSDVDAEAYLVASNSLTALGGWDGGGLADLLGELAEFDPALLEVTGYSQGDLEDMLAGLDSVTHLPPALSEPDDVPDAPVIPKTEPGDLWILGPHRLLCGDATNPQHLDRLLADLGDPGIVYTDPPYGISIVNEYGKVGHPTGTPFGGVAKGTGPVIPTTHYLPVAGDASPEVAGEAFRLLWSAYPKAAHVWWGANHYAASAGLPDSSYWLVWDKDTGENTFADCELAWTSHPGAVRLLRHMWNGMLRASERGKRVHPTQKPVALAEWAFEQVDPKAERRVVLDVFGGSGSTLIAAHQTGRAAAICELEPHYVDIIARRYQEATDDKPVLASTGEPVDFCTGGDDG
jgi:hypothetical protein